MTDIQSVCADLLEARRSCAVARRNGWWVKPFEVSDEQAEKFWDVGGKRCPSCGAVWQYKRGGTMEMVHRDDCLYCAWERREMAEYLVVEEASRG